MNRIHSIVALFLATFVAAVYAACNPKVEKPECTTEIVEECGGVTGPSASGVTAEARCDRFVFELQNVRPGSETLKRTRRWHGEGDCPPDETLSSVTRSLTPSVTWSVTAGSVTRTGSGAKAEMPRPDGVCTASCMFTLTISPSKCSATSTAVYNSAATFTNAVAVLGGGPRVCTTSSSHGPPRFPYSVECDKSKSTSVTGNAVKVSDDGTAVVVRGTAAGSAAVRVSADCGSAEKTFDVVELDRLTLHGCGCIDGDDGAFETMAGMGEVTATLTTTPVKYSGETYTVVTSEVSGGVARGWFDCERDGIEADDEPKTNRAYAVVKLGEIEAVDGDCSGNVNKTGAVKLSLGRIYELTETGGRHLKGTAKLAVIGFKPKRKSSGGVSPSLSGDGGNWTLDLSDARIPSGTLTLRLTDSAHTCDHRDFDFEIVGCECECSSCGQFGKMTGGNGCIELRFGLGRNANGTAMRPLQATLERTDALPPFVSSRCAEGNVEVSVTNGVMSLVFTRTGEAAPVVICRLTPGAGIFLADEYRGGSHLSRIRRTASRCFRPKRSPSSPTVR